MEQAVGDEQFWIWFAGFMDGEGYIGVVKNTQHKRKTGTKNIFKVTVSVANTNFNAGKYIRENIKYGCLRICNYEGKKPYWMIQWWSNQAVSIVKRILPYLKVKKEQGLLVIEFQKTKRKKGGRQPKLSNEELNKRTSFYLESKELTKGKNQNQEVFNVN